MAAKSKWLADIFHSFPHLDFDFEWTTTVFTPNGKGYLQALMFNGIILLFIAVVLFLGFMLYFLVCSCYFCSRCHPPLKPKPYKSRCLRSLIAVFAFLSCVSLGVGFYGNNKASAGVDHFASAATDIYDTWDMFAIKNTVAKQYLEEGTNSTVYDLISALKRNNIPVPAVLSNLSSIVHTVLKDLNISNQRLANSKVDLKHVADDTIYYDNLRWWITIAIHCWHLLVILVVFYAAWRERKCPFVLLTIMSVLCLFYMSGSVSIEVPFSIGAADICIAPQEAVYRSVHSPADKVVVSYYLNCVNRTANPLLKIQHLNVATDELLRVGPSPLTTPGSAASKPMQLLMCDMSNVTISGKPNYQNAQESLSEVGKILKVLDEDPFIQKLNKTKYYLDKLTKFFANIDIEVTSLIQALDCTFIHKRFNDGIHAVCFTVLDGLSLLILAALMLSVFLVCIIVCITPIWKSMARLRSILRKPVAGVRLVTGSYSGPPGREGFLNSSWDTSLDASYKSINEEQQGRTDESVPLVSQEEPPAQYSAVHGSTEFLSVEEDRRKHLQAETTT